MSSSAPPVSVVPEIRQLNASSAWPVGADKHTTTIALLMDLVTVITDLFQPLTKHEKFHCLHYPAIRSTKQEAIPTLAESLIARKQDLAQNSKLKVPQRGASVPYAFQLMD